MSEEEESGLSREDIAMTDDVQAIEEEIEDLRSDIEESHDVEVPGPEDIRSHAADETTEVLDHLIEEDCESEECERKRDTLAGLVEQRLDIGDVEDEPPEDPPEGEEGEEGDNGGDGGNGGEDEEKSNWAKFGGGR